MNRDELRLVLRGAAATLLVGGASAWLALMHWYALLFVFIVGMVLYVAYYSNRLAKYFGMEAK